MKKGDNVALQLSDGFVGRDVHGQHGRASIRAADLWGAAEFDVPIPLQRDDERADQGGLFQDG